MALEFKFSAEARFVDSRPMKDVKFDIEKRVWQLLQRDWDQPEALVFRGVFQNVSSGDITVYQLRVEAAFDTHNLYALLLDFNGAYNPANETLMDRITKGLACASPGLFRQLLEESSIPEPPVEDPEGILAIQESIVTRLRQGKRFFTAHHEGGTQIKWIVDRFVFQDYGESDDREEFTAEAPFFQRLREFYDGKARYTWFPHPPPELEVWRFIGRELN